LAGFKSPCCRGAHMRPLPRAPTLLFGAGVCLFWCLGASGQWADVYKNPRSWEDLDKSLAQHKLWLASKQKRGAQARLEGWHLSHVGLYMRNLSYVVFARADLSEAYLRRTDLDNANLLEANLSHADLTDADLSHAELTMADLRGANLTRVNLSGANLDRAVLTGAVFEPKSLPPLEGIAQAAGLEQMTYEDNPGPLTRLRKEFQDAGFRQQERAITYVLNRHETINLDSSYMLPFLLFEALFKWIAFDLTCQYGLTPGRPLRLVMWLWLFFSGVYGLFIHMTGPSGIYFVASRQWRGKSNTQGIQIRPRAIRAKKWWKLPRSWLLREWRVFRAAMFFSLMSAFNIGFRDINFGRWLRLLTKREYDLKAVGWARTVSGFQSLLSVYLIALWVLTYFGRPFG
jgi:hypothetical protein